MVFSSLHFLCVFLPIVLFLYLIFPKRSRNILLLISSLFFYAWGEKLYVILMLISIVFNHFLCLLADKYSNRFSSKSILVFAVVLNLGLLAFFKYTGFIITNINHVLLNFNVPTIDAPSIHLPIGISFFTFQSLSYVIDVYRKDVDVQKSLTKTALYISLFPQLIAGPIIRYQEIANQLANRVLSVEKFSYGIKRFIIGLGKKVLIADILAAAADQIYSIPPHNLTTELAWVGAIGFTLQIYFDFSGYSDMAIGLGCFFGFTIPENFNYPYIAQSITDLWRRWHMSLTRWFRDYLFLPTYIKRRNWGKWGLVYALLINFGLIGLWHGAGWNFVIWGLFNGTFLMLESLKIINVEKFRFPLIKWFYAIIVFIIGAVIFRTKSMSMAFSFFKAMSGFAEGDSAGYHLFYYIDNLTIMAIVFGVLGSTPLFSHLYKQVKERFKTHDTISVKLFEPVFQISGMVSLFVILAICFMRLSVGSYTPFIYFRF